MPDSLTVRRVLGDRPFAEIGTPSAVAVSEERGIAVVGGDLGSLSWSGCGVAGYGWKRYRVGVHGTDDLRCRLLVESRWPVRSVAVHPTLPLVAVGTGEYDGEYTFDGELLLIDLESGRSRSMMRRPREVLRVQWESERELRLVVAATDDDDPDELDSHAYDVVVERPDWSAAPRGSVQQKELAGNWVEFDRSALSGQAARRTVEKLAGESCGEPRRQVWDVRGLPDGRVLACLRGVLAEAWLPDGRLDWRVADEVGGRQLVVRERDAWVNVARRPETWRGWEPGTEAPFVTRVCLADGSTLGTLTLGHSVTFATRQDGWLALRSTASSRQYEPQPQPVALIPPAEDTPRATTTLGEFGPGNHCFPVRHSSRLLFLDGRERVPSMDKWVVAVDPEDESVPERLFPLDWQSPPRHLVGGPGIELGPPGNRELVHTGSVHVGIGERAFVVRRSLTDGAVRWVFTAKYPATAVDGDEDTVYVSFNTGELVALHASDGTVHWRQHLKVGGRCVVPLSLELTDPGRLLIGTVDGRILDCSVGRRAAS
ncbi:PQQ-like beta-propeller repeat protein [Streptomyces sp. AC550_RSS872]|uniref:PQQ-like beta-propeller repeat protein n=1 Tax=Streptomyces sp. AC550_RSS872 TaxID=2823689 RepID=UPI001C26DBF4|nr:PQQ-like beta-propeller repeat protein [Streptomyces sp. AC550_RSS872]